MISRRSTLALCAALVAGGAISALAIEYNQLRLAARLDGDVLHVSAPNLSFLSGKSLERLKDGTSVAFIAQLTVSRSPNYLIADAQSMARFAVSRDIWDESFSVTRIADRPEQKRAASHLSLHEAESWCLDKLTINRPDLPADKPFYVQLDLRVEDPRDHSGIIGDTGISVERILENFSQPVRGRQDSWQLRSGPIHLDELLKGMHG